MSVNKICSKTNMFIGNFPKIYCVDSFSTVGTKMPCIMGPKQTLKASSFSPLFAGWSMNTLARDPFSERAGLKSVSAKSSKLVKTQFTFCTRAWN